MRIDTDIPWMKPIEPIFGQSFEPDEIVQLLSVSREDIDEKFPIKHVSVGFTEGG